MTQKLRELLETVLAEANEFVDNYVDVIDGDDGQPRPNRAMNLQGSIKQAEDALAREAVARDRDSKPFHMLVGLLCVIGQGGGYVNPSAYAATLDYAATEAGITSTQLFDRILALDLDTVAGRAGRS